MIEKLNGCAGCQSSMTLAEVSAAKNHLLPFSSTFAQYFVNGQHSTLVLVPQRSSHRVYPWIVLEHTCKVHGDHPLCTVQRTPPIPG